MNTQIESGLRMMVSGLLAVVFTSIVVFGIGNGSGSHAARAAFASTQRPNQVATIQAPAAGARMTQTDEPQRAG